MRVQGSATKGPGTRTVPETEPNLAGERFDVDVNTTTDRLWLRGLHAHSISIY